APSLLRYFFFLPIPQPPRATLFPYRRSSDLAIGHRGTLQDPPALDVVGVHELIDQARLPDAGLPDDGDDLALAGLGPLQRLTERSEEHTSELQSRSDLVCRLLLEKKNNNATT